MKKILLAEDDFYIRDIYSFIFSIHQEYELEQAIDGAVAIDKIRNNDYDLILLDIMMPKFTGVDVLKTLRGLDVPKNETPVYIITNLGQKDMLNELFKVGIEGYIVKSEITPAELFDEVERFFNQKNTPS